MLFKVGDRVVLLGVGSRFCGNAHMTPGIKGTVAIVYNQSDPKSFVGVEWDNPVDGHDCNGACEKYKGWDVYPYMIQICENDDSDYEISTENETLELLFG